MSHQREVESQECINILLNHVRGGKMDDDLMRHFVEHLGELSEMDPNVLFGNHMRRMGRDKERRQDRTQNFSKR